MTRGGPPEVVCRRRILGELGEIVQTRATPVNRVWVVGGCREAQFDCFGVFLSSGAFR